MKRWHMAWILALAGTAHAADMPVLRVVATTSDVAAVVQRVGGARVEVTTLAPASMDPHYLEAKPSYIVSLRKADLLVYNGLQLEIGWLPLLLDGARNRRIAWGEVGNVVLSRGLEILEVPGGSLSRAQGDIHPEGNPHYTMDPRNVVHMAGTVEEALVRLDAAGAAVYAQNRAAFTAEIERAIPGWEERLQPYRGSKVVCYHKQFEYLLAWLGIVPVDYVENKPGIPPSPRHLEELEARMQAEHIPLLLSSTFVNPEHLQNLAEHSGARLVVIPAALGAVPQTEAPLFYFEYLVTQIERGFEEAKAP